MAFTLLTETAAAAIVGHNLALGSCPPGDSRFEILRTAVWGLAAPAGKAHVNRVVAAALPLWQLLTGRPTGSEVTLRAELREALSMLEDAGDLVELSGGYWAPAVMRVVNLPGSVGHLLVGGTPSSMLGVDADTIQFHGPYRHLQTLPSALSTVLPVDSLVSWAKLPGEQLQDWARDVVESFVRQPYLPNTGEVFEFYRPGSARRGTPQFKRWSEDAGTMTSTLLARRRRIYGAREYRLVDVREGRIVGVSGLHDVDIRRLMYAFDLAAGNPVRVTRLSGGEAPTWLFTSDLPRAEQRTFAAFGTLTVSQNRPFERRWTFVRNEAFALELLRALGIRLENWHGEVPR